MAEDVCDSWEEMIENGASINRIGDGIKILKRNSNPNQVNQVTQVNQVVAQNNSSTQNLAIPSKCKVKSKNFDLNNYVNSKPFVPQNYKSLPTQLPQIMLEDNTRTQYMPQVKILKRPKEASNKSLNEGENKVSPSKNISNQGSLSTKSLQEREAEYAKVRLRILGSAVPDYQDQEPSNTIFTALSTSSLSYYKVNNETINKNLDVPIIRNPQGPDGSKGFSNRR